MGSLAAPFRPFSLRGSLAMPYAGDFGSVDAGEIIPLTLDFASVLGADTIEQCAGAISVYYGSDANAASLPLSGATFTGSKVSQLIGPGFLPGVIYQWGASIVTASKASYTAFARFLCADAQSPSSLALFGDPIVAFPITTNASVLLPGAYILKATGLTILLPPTWTFPQSFSITDATGESNPNQTIVGPFARSPLTMSNAYQSETFVWDATDQQFIVT